MSSVMFPDFLGTLGKAAAFENASAQRDWLDEDRKAKAEIAPLIPKALAGDKDALGQIGTRHPDTAMKLAPLLERLDASQRAKAKESADYITSTGMAILNAPPEQQPQLYAKVRADAAASGRDVSTWPTTYDPGWVKFNVDKAMPFAEHFKRSGEGVTFAPPTGGGGPAPSGGGIDRSAGAISGIESGGRYDAVGPAANEKGQRAYGKYQVMDFNVGPWTQEILGQAMTPQQFLASPQAQDAVFKAKFGQYIQKHGSPEAASRAWFAGEGGMNNPGAKDVLGTSVAGYGSKFAQAYGAGATGPQVAQGSDMPAADGSGTPLPPAQQALAPLKGLQIPPGARVALKGGLPVIQDGNVLYVDANGGWGAAPLPSRAAPKEQGAGPFAGTGVEAQALNMLIANGTLTPQQAAELAAGKTITDPKTGVVVFMTPTGIMGQAPNGQTAPIPIPGVAAPAPAAAPAPGAAPGTPAPAGAPQAPAPATRAGVIPLTSAKPETMTESQAKAYGFAQRMATANSLLDDLAIQGTSKRGRFLEGLPGGLGNLAQTPEFQRFEQAKRNFMNAQLRDESGAVIGPSEFMSADLQYFPQPGQETNKELLAQMAENRRQVVEAMMVKAGMLKRGERYDPPAKSVDGAEKGRLVFEAKKAIKEGRDPNGVRQKLKSLGVDPAELDKAD